MVQKSASFVYCSDDSVGRGANVGGSLILKDGRKGCACGERGTEISDDDILGSGSAIQGRFSNA